MTRFPLMPTMLVALAVAAMIALGLWHCSTACPQKEAFLAQLAANPAKPAIAFPRFPDDDAAVPPRVGACCLQPIASSSPARAPPASASSPTAARGAEGPGMLVQLGTTRDPEAKPEWNGGTVDRLSSATRPTAAR